jgi:hypothetical protein
VLGDYFAGDLSPERANRVEDHVFNCDACGRAFDRIGAIAQALREQMPVAISRERLDQLSATGMRIRQAPVVAGTPVEVVFARDLDLLVPTLLADLTGVRRLGIELSVPDGPPIVSIDDIPFDRERGEVLIACQRHYMDAFPRLVTFRLFAVSDEGTDPIGEYVINHLVE